MGARCTLLVEVGGVVSEDALEHEDMTQEYRNRAAGVTGAVVAEGSWQRGRVVGGQATVLAEVMLTQQRLPVETLRSQPSLKGKERMPRDLLSTPCTILWGHPEDYLS